MHELWKADAASGKAFKRDANAMAKLRRTLALRRYAGCMLLTVLCALMGAYIGLSGRSLVIGVLLAAVLATAAYYALVYAMAFLIAFAPDPAGARRILHAWGAPGSSLSRVAGAAAFSALVASVLFAIVSPGEGSNRPPRGATGLTI